MNPTETPKEYSKYVNKKSPNSPILKDCFNAFWVGGLICTIGQFIFFYCKYKGLDQTSCSTIVSISLIGIAIFLSAIMYLIELANSLVQVLLYLSQVLLIQ